MKGMRSAETTAQAVSTWHEKGFLIGLASIGDWRRSLLVKREEEGLFKLLSIGH